HHLVSREIECAQPAPERDLHVALAEKAQRRLDENLAEPVAGDQRPTGLPPRRQCFADDGASEAGAPLFRIDVERRQPERPRPALVERAAPCPRLPHAPFPPPLP